MKNKIILVTGASSGIGKETAILLSKIGAKVILVARSENKLKQTFANLENSGHAWYSFDLKNIIEINSLVNKIIKDNGKLDGFVHCAGISELRPLKMTKYDFLHDMMLINFYSFVELVRCISQKGNYSENHSIVAMSSVAASKGFKAKVAYSASKAAIEGSIRSMSKELSDKKIRINSVTAGFVRTEMFERFKDRTAINENNAELSQYILGIPGPIDIAKSIVHLLSSNSLYITGNTIVIDSGYSI